MIAVDACLEGCRYAKLADENALTKATPDE